MTRRIKILCFIAIVLTLTAGVFLAKLKTLYPSPEKKEFFEVDKTDTLYGPIQPDVKMSFLSHPRNSPAKLQINEKLDHQPPLKLIVKEITVKAGDTLMKILKSSGVSSKRAALLISSLRKVYDLTRLQVGQTFRITIIDGPVQTNNKKRELIKLSFSPNFDLEVTAELQRNGSFKIDKRKIELIIEEQFVEGSITSSLYQTAVDIHLPINILMEVIRIFSFDVDFQREIRPGDSFGVLFEVHKNQEQQVIHNSTVNWASMTLRGKKYEYASYINKSRIMDYYDRKGQSVKKTLMRTPIDGAKLSSQYGRRRHPILGYTKMHKGVDFAAPKGVSIMAAGDGVIEYIGDKGPYGNYIRIRHNSIYKTAYAHLSRFRNGLKKGRRVRQGTTIGYVGSTGRSTGPHLHYEVIKHGRQTNPMSVRLPAGDKLKGKALLNLQKYWLELDKKLTKVMTTNTE